MKPTWNLLYDPRCYTSPKFVQEVFAPYPPDSTNDETQRAAKVAADGE